MSCQTNPWLDYSQYSGVTPNWFLQNDGCLSECGCLPQSSVCQPIRRRFSPYCRVLDITPAAPQAYFRVAPSVQNDASSLTFSFAHTTMEVKRKGTETCVATYPAWRRDANGYIGFFFDNSLFCSPAGYYIGDIFIDCKYCFSVTLRLPKCEAFVTDCYVQPNLEECGQGECSIMDPIGVGVVGGLECNLPWAANSCGPVAPYFPIENPAAPQPPCPDDSACCFNPSMAAGMGSAG